MTYPRPKNYAPPSEVDIDRYNEMIDNWVRQVESCLGGPISFDVRAFRRDIGLTAQYDENANEGLLKQLLVNKNYLVRRLFRLDAIIQRKQSELNKEAS